MTKMPSAFNLSHKLCIFLFLLIAFSSNFVQSDDLAYSESCTKLSTALDQEMQSMSFTPLPFLDLKTHVASSELFFTDMRTKMAKFSAELTEFVNISNNHLPAKKCRLFVKKEGAIQTFGEMLKTGTEIATILEVVLKFGHKTRPEHLRKIFTLLDNLTIRIMEEKSAKEERKKLQNLEVSLPPSEEEKSLSQSIKLAEDVVEKVNKFVRHLKRELIYAQSETIIRKMNSEFKSFMEKEIKPIRDEAANFARDHFNTLKGIVSLVDYYEEEQRAMLTTGLYDDDLYKQQQQPLEEGEGISQKPAKGKSSLLWSRNKSKGMEKLPLLSEDQLHQHQQIGGVVKPAGFFDKFEAMYLMETHRITKDFLIEYHDYLYVYDLLKNAVIELNHKMQILVIGLVTKREAEVVNEYENEIKIVFVLVEKIVKPLLKVIDKQLGYKNGQGIEKQIVVNLAIPEKVLIAESARRSSAIQSGGERTNEKAIRQFRIHINAVKILVIYERMQFFFNLFKNARKMAITERKEKTREWLKGNLNGVKKGAKAGASSSSTATNEPEELYNLPERFGQLIVYETKKLMMTEGKA